MAGLAGVLETFGGLLLLVGLFARPVAFLLSGEMAVAYFVRHAPLGFWPILNRGEAALLFCFLWLYLAAAGPGPWSLDALRGRGAATPLSPLTRTPSTMRDGGRRRHPAQTAGANGRIVRPSSPRKSPAWEQGQRSLSGRRRTSHYSWPAPRQLGIAVSPPCASHVVSTVFLRAVTTAVLLHAVDTMRVP